MIFGNLTYSLGLRKIDIKSFIITSFNNNDLWFCHQTDIFYDERDPITFCSWNNKYCGFCCKLNFFYVSIACCLSKQKHILEVSCNV